MNNDQYRPSGSILNGEVRKMLDTKSFEIEIVCNSSNSILVEIVKITITYWL